MARLSHRTRRKKGPPRLRITPQVFVALSLLCLFWLIQVSPRNLLSPFDVPSLLPPQYWLFFFSLVCLALVLVLGRAKLKRALNAFHSVPALLGFSGFAFTFLRSLSESGLSRSTLDLFSGLMIVPVAYLAGVFIREPVSWFWKIFLASFLPLLAFALMMGPNSVGKFTVYSVNSIEFGLLMATASIVALFLASNATSPLFLIVSSVFAMGIFLSGSRGATLAWIIALGSTLILGDRSWTVALRHMRKVALVVGMALCLTLVWENLRAREGDIATFRASFSSSRGSSRRTEIWTGVLREIWEGSNFLIGHGIVDGVVPLGRSHPHNMILLYSLVGGILAVVTILYFILGGPLRLMAKPHPGSSVLLASLVVLWFTHLQFAGNFGEGLNLFLLAGVLWGIGASRQEHAGELEGTAHS